MTVTYEAGSLAELAHYLTAQAVELRDRARVAGERAGAPGMTQKRAAELDGVATGFEMAARIVAATTLQSEKKGLPAP